MLLLLPISALSACGLLDNHGPNVPDRIEVSCLEYLDVTPVGLDESEETNTIGVSLYRLTESGDHVEMLLGEDERDLLGCESGACIFQAVSFPTERYRFDHHYQARLSFNLHCPPEWAEACADAFPNEAFDFRADNLNTEEFELWGEWPLLVECVGMIY